MFRNNDTNVVILDNRYRSAQGIWALIEMLKNNAKYRYLTVKSRDRLP